MRRWLIRFVLLLAFAAGSAAALRTLRERRRNASDAVGARAEWPPLEAVAQRDPTPSLDGPPETNDSGDPSTDWRPSTDGGCPEGFPVKATNNSRIFHVPGGRFYDKTVPDRCYASTAAAERDGYRQAKA